MQKNRPIRGAELGEVIGDEMRNAVTFVEVRGGDEDLGAADLTVIFGVVAHLSVFADKGQEDFTAIFAEAEITAQILARNPELSAHEIGKLGAAMS